MIRVCGGQHISALPLQRGCMSSKCQLVTQSFQQQWKPFEDEAEYEKPRLQWCQRTAASASALIAGSSCNQKLAGIKKLPNESVVCLGFSRQACGIITIISAHLSGQVMRRICTKKKKRCKAQRPKDPYALGNSWLLYFFVMCLQGHISDAQRGCVEMDKSMRPSGERKSRWEMV